jgi:hypothetical protein
MDPKDTKIAEDLKGLFQKVESVSVELDPFLETRVLANWRSRDTGKGLLFWKRLALGASACSLILLLGMGTLLLRAVHPEAYVGEPFAVRLDVKDLAKHSIARAQIRLPAGVAFEIDDYPELRESQELNLTWNNRGETQFVPFLLKASESGLKTVVIRFFDEKNALVAEKSLSVKLSRPRGRSES